MRILTDGSRGSEVALLQTGLRRAGYGTTADGVFGPATRRAVMAFQKDRALVPDGVFGPRTEAALAPWLRGWIVHSVPPGDTLWRIARRYGSDLLSIETANPALDPFALFPGQRLTVPLPFAVTPTDIPWSSALTEYASRGLVGRSGGRLQREIFGHSVRGTPLYALSVGGGPAEEILARCRLVFVPLVDPDGVDLVTGALGAPWLTSAGDIAAMWPDIPFPSGWKANIEGVDLNLQYPALWETAREIKFSQGFIAPAPRDYVGPAPLSAPESRALAALTRREDPDLVLAFHTQGETIYWRFLDREVPGSRALGELLSEVSGYALEDAPYASGFAGYKDWFIEQFGRPGYTVEAGRGENPLPLTEFASIWRSCAPLITAAALAEI